LPCITNEIIAVTFYVHHNFLAPW